MYHGPRGALHAVRAQHPKDVRAQVRERHGQMQVRAKQDHAGRRHGGRSYGSKAAAAETESFDKASAGAVPPAWTCGITGRGTPRWTVEADVSAPSPPNILKQSSKTARGAAYPWCEERRFDCRWICGGEIQAAWRIEDQVGGVVWRWKGWRQLLCRARANALEGNVWLWMASNISTRTIVICREPAPSAFGPRPTA